MTATPRRVLRRSEVESRVGLDHSVFYRLERRGKFPKRFKISERASGWLESEIEAWIADRAASRGVAA